MKIDRKLVALYLFSSLAASALAIRARQAEPARPGASQAAGESADPQGGSQAGGAEITEEAFRAAIRKLREPLDERQEFDVGEGTDRFATMSELTKRFGRRAVHEAIDREVERKNPGGALEALEAHRWTREGGSLLARLQSRKPRLTPEDDLDLKWITNQLKAANLLLDRAQLGSRELDRLEAQKRELQNRRWQLNQRYYAGPTGPVPLTVERVQAALDPGTVVLSYFMDQPWESPVPTQGDPPPADHIDLLVIRQGSPVQTHRIEIAEGELLRLMHDFLPPGVRVFGRGARLLPEARSAGGKQEAEAAQRLYQALIAPAEETIAAGDHVLVIPDGLLYQLPFAALMRQDKSGARSYFVEWKPIHVAPSIAIYLELLARRERADRKTARGARRLLAFGDPVYGEGIDADSRSGPMAVRYAVYRGLSGGLRPLPGTGREVMAIADLFRAAGAPTEILLRTEASERAVKEKAAAATYLHLAAHGVLDPDQYESSFLALTLPKGPALVGEDGILEAWEVNDQLGLTADLVTLSACETALGRGAYGDGVLSMGHAYQMAGAQSVLASLWQVSDQPTADLMVRFYRKLLDGLPKDRALQEAQVAMLRGELRRGRTAPYDWAAFQLFGDWR